MRSDFLYTVDGIGLDLINVRLDPALAGGARPRHCPEAKYRNCNEDRGAKGQADIGLDLHFRRWRKLRLRSVEPSRATVHRTVAFKWVRVLYLNTIPNKKHHPDGWCS